MRLLLLIVLAIASPPFAQTVFAQTAPAETAPADTGAEPAADLVAGKAAFKRCTACHDVGETPTNRMGPYLTGVVGRPAASVEKFGYSAAMKTARDAGLVWTPDSLNAFLSGPHAYVPGTKMPNLKVPDADRANLVAYLQSVSPDFDPDTQKSTYAPPQ